MLPECNELKNKDTIPVDQLVLLEIEWNTFEKETGNNWLLGLEVVQIHQINAVPDSYDGIRNVFSYLIK